MEEFSHRKHSTGGGKLYKQKRAETAANVCDGGPSHRRSSDYTKVGAANGLSVAARCSATLFSFSERRFVMDQLVPLIIQLIGGAAGGNAAGAMLKNANMTALLRTILGVVGGVGGTQLADMMGLVQNLLGDTAGTGEMLAGNAGISAIAGAVLTLVVGMIKQSMAGHKAS
jgi:hypothetical protein